MSAIRRKKDESLELDFVRRTCDPCKFEQAESKAQGFCQKCREYLCEKCEQFHRKFQATRGHKIVHGVLMPKPVKTSMTACEYHGNNSVEFFCKDHSDVICSECKETKHGKCKSVQPLGFYQSTEIEKGKLDKLTTNLQNRVADFRNVLELRKMDKIDMNKQFEKCQEDIWKLRSNLNSFLDELEKKMHSELKEVHGHGIKVTKEHEEICEKSIGVLESCLEDVTGVRKTEDNLATFSMYQKAMKKLTDYGHVLRDIKREAQTVELEIKGDDAVVEYFKNLESFGSIQTRIVPKTFHLKLKDLKKENMRVVETLVHSVRMPGDDEEHDCEVTGSTFLQDGSLAVCDKHNRKVKLMDRQLFCKHELQLEGAPWDVAEVNANWIVTSLPFVKKLMFLHADIDEGLRKGRAIKTDRMCWGVAVSADDIFVSCHDNPGHGKIHILDKRGHTKKIIDAEAEGSTYTFELPSYLAVSAAGDKIFVADGDLKRTITCINKKHGDIVYDYSVTPFGYSKQSNMGQYQNPWSFKIIVDQDDYVLANVGDKDMIQVITDSGQKFKTLLRNTEELFGPHTMSYRECDATLIIGLWDQVQSFRFKEIVIKA